MRFVTFTLVGILLGSSPAESMSSKPRSLTTIPCELKVSSENEASLHIGELSAPVKIISKEAESLSCRQLTGESALVSAEIKLGTGGTSTQTSPVHLFVFQRKDSSKLEKIFETYLGDAEASDGLLDYELEDAKTELRVKVGSSRRIVSLETTTRAP